MDELLCKFVGEVVINPSCIPQSSPTSNQANIDLLSETWVYFSIASKLGGEKVEIYWEKCQVGTEVVIPSTLHHGVAAMRPGC